MFEFQSLELSAGGRRLLGPLDGRLPQEGGWVLCGPSGCGKSMLLKVMAGLARPFAGSVRFAGHALGSGFLGAHRRRVHLVAQSPWLGDGSLGQALALGHSLRGLPAPDPLRLRDELASLGLSLLDLQAPAAGLSGGERMRVAILRGLLLPVEALLLDEPTTGLDDASAALLIERLAAPGVPPLYSASHDPRWLAACRHRLDLREGPLHAG